MGRCIGYWRKAIRNWMDFKDLSNIPIEPKYISNVISSSAGIEGWANYK